MGQIQRIRYIDDSGTTQVIGILGADPDNPPSGPSAQASLSQMRLKRQIRAQNVLKVWGSHEIFGELPLSVSDHDADEPEIFMDEWDGSSWNTVFRGYAESQGSITANGQTAFKLYTFAKYTGMQKAEHTDPTTTNIVDALSDILPSGYVVDAPDSGDVDGGYPSISDYTLVERRVVGYRELTKNYDWAIRFTPDKDDSGDYKVRFEPVGYGGTVDDIVGTRDAVEGDEDTTGLFKEWKKESTKNLVNDVEVVGVSSDGTKYVGTASDSDSIDDYGKHFERSRIDYRVDSQDEVDKIAENFLNTTPEEGGRIKTNQMYEADVANDSFNITDTTRGVDGVFTCTKQVNFYPEKSTYLTFQFETDAERQAGQRENLRSERNRLVRNTGEESTTHRHSNDSLENDSSQTDLSVSDDGENPDTAPSISSGFSTDDGGATKVVESKNSAENKTLEDRYNDVWTISAESEPTQMFYVYMHYDIKPTATPPEGGNVAFTTQNAALYNNTEEEDELVFEIYDYHNSFLYDDNGDVDWERCQGDLTFVVPRNVYGEEFIVRMKVSQECNLNWAGYALWIGEHSHGAGTYEALDHNHSAGVDNDPGHGGSDDDYTHSITGDVDEQSLDVDTASSEQEDR